ncbi:MAG: type II secretion system protein [Phycisphaerae bacterium]|nr:type II secretion system protein [Phycisphaerae bacterium]
MKRKKGFTLIELLVVIAIIAMLLAILMPALSKVKKIAQRVVCGTNLKGLGTAQMVYANDYDDQYVKQGRGVAHTWTADTVGMTGGWQQGPGKNWSTPDAISIGASLYLLVREADVSPKSFVCGGGGQTVFDGKNQNNWDITELWDFGHPNYENTGPARTQSYAYHFPYGRYPADGSSSASFAVMADRSPWFDEKLSTLDPTKEDWTSRVGNLRPYWVTGLAWEKWEVERANSAAHGREGQNVLFGDGHSSYEKTPDVGINHDQIYTIRTPGTGADPESRRIRQGTLGPYTFAYNSPLHPTTKEDSFLVGDSKPN